MSAPIYGPRDRMSRKLSREFHSSVDQWAENTPSLFQKVETLICLYGFSAQEAERWVNVPHALFRVMLDHTDGDIAASDRMAANLCQSGYITVGECAKRLFWPRDRADQIAAKAATEGEDALP